MAKVDWGKVAQTVKGVINDLREERTVTLTKPSEVAVDPTKPWLGNQPGAAVSYTAVPAVMVPIMNSDESNSRGKRMVRLYIAGPDVPNSDEIKSDWTITDELTNSELEITDVNVTQPGTNIILFTIDGVL